jgi:hypothetical protein
VTEGPGPLFTFETTHMALWAEDTARECRIPAELVPAPAQAKAKCGLALRTLAARFDELAGALREEGVQFGVYEAEAASPDESESHTSAADGAPPPYDSRSA